VLHMMGREPMPLCDDHPKRFGLTVAAMDCPVCGRETNSVYVMCGWCAQDRGVCVVDGNPSSARVIVSTGQNVRDHADSPYG
jgi:hypothetical protein